MNDDPVRDEHRFRSCHTIYSVHFVHGRHTGPSNPLTKSKGSTKASLEPLDPTLRQHRVACTLLVPANIRAITRRYRKVRHTQTLRHAIVRQLCYPSNIFPPIAFSLRRHFFTGGFAIPYPESEYGKQCAQIIRRTPAIIQSESTTHGTSLTVAVLMLPAGGVKK